MWNDPNRPGMQRRTPGRFCCTEQVWAASGAETAETESAAVVQVTSSSDEGAAQDESGVSVAMCITEDDTPLSIPDEETPPSGNAGTGFWSILFQLLKHLAGKH